MIPVTFYLQSGNPFFQKRNDVSFIELEVNGEIHITSDIRGVIPGKLEVVTSKGTLKKDNYFDIQEREIESGHIIKVTLEISQYTKHWQTWGLSSTNIEFNPKLLGPFNTTRLETCKCLYEYHEGLPRTRSCLKACEAQINITENRNTLENVDNLVKVKLTREQLLEKLSHIENVVKDYRGQPRRYYRMKTDPKDWDAVVTEACTVLFPDMKIEIPGVVEWIKENYPADRKIEIWPDGTAWVRTILV